MEIITGTTCRGVLIVELPSGSAIEIRIDLTGLDADDQREAIRILKRMERTAKMARYDKED